jgi:DNA repair protein RecO (recombination protein O)
VSQYRDTGVVLRTHKLGEADRIVVLLTEHHGKVRAVAKGVRRTRSRFGARLEPPTAVDTVTSAETVDAFRAVREDLDRLGQAMAMLEAVDQLAVEGEADPALFRMLVRALALLATDAPPLVVPAFYLKVLAQSGFGPMVDACVACGSVGPLVAFDAARGGMLCGTHRSGMAVSGDAVDLVVRILGGQLSSALAEPPSPATAEVDRLATGALEHHLERRLRAPGVLHRG